MPTPHPTNRFPPFTWDSLGGLRDRALAAAGGLVDLSMGSPGDPVSPLVARALAGAAQAPGYPDPRGGADVREAYAAWLRRRRGVDGIDPDTQVLPSTGSKEMISLLPLALGADSTGVVLHPPLAYPTYATGARVVGARAARYTGPGSPADGVTLLWLNNPTNPTGALLSRSELAGAVEWGRRHGVVVASDECYLDMVWQGTGTSVLDAAISGTDRHGVLAFHSLSKQSNLAGYRAGFVTGDARLVARLLEFRKHTGLLVPTPVQAAMVAALADDAHADAQRDRYLRRHAMMSAALTHAGFRIDASLAGPFLWATRGLPARTTAEHLADLGILVTPGDVYGPDGARHVRLALTAADHDIDRAARRLTGTSHLERT